MKILLTIEEYNLRFWKTILRSRYNKWSVGEGGYLPLSGALVIVLSILLMPISHGGPSSFNTTREISALKFTAYDNREICEDVDPRGNLGYSECTIHNRTLYALYVGNDRYEEVSAKNLNVISQVGIKPSHRSATNLRCRGLVIKWGCRLPQPKESYSTTDVIYLPPGFKVEYKDCYDCPIEAKTWDSGYLDELKKYSK